MLHNKYTSLICFTLFPPSLLQSERYHQVSSSTNAEKQLPAIEPFHGGEGEPTYHSKIQDLIYSALELEEQKLKQGTLPKQIDLDDHQATIAYSQNLERNLKFNEALKESDDDHGDFVPVIGIITQPVHDSKKHTFDYNDYILEVNDNFARWAGSKTVASPYDVSEGDLVALLDQINGVLLTGGALTLVDDEGNLHPYYQTAKRVIEYSKMKKDVQGEDWPILGVCQGLEVVSVYQSNDDIKALDKIDIYGENRPVSWTGADSVFFEEFPDEIRYKMGQEGLALHAHTYSTSMDTYHRMAGLRDEMVVTQTDTWHDAKNVSGSATADVEFIAAMEHKHYPIYASMYHPEYQLLVFTGDRQWTTIDNAATDEIAFHFSDKLRKVAQTNSNRVRAGNEALFDWHMAVTRVPSQEYPMIDGIAVYAYGFDRHHIADEGSTEFIY